jgi:AAA domain-containing protein
MNPFEELTNRRLKRIDEINKMSGADLDQLLSTKPPIVTAADIDSPLADAIRQNGPVHDPSKNVIDPEELEDAYFDKSWDYDQLSKEGLFNVQGYAPRRYVREYVHELVMVKNKLVVVVAGTEDDLFDAVGDRRWVRRSESVDSIPHGVIRIITTINDEPSGEAYDLTEQEYAIALRDEIATKPIEAVVLIDQEGKLKFLDEITNVPVYRGKKISHVKKIPIFHIHTENWEWVEKCRNGQAGMQLKKEVFERVAGKDAPVVAETDRIGCVESASDIRKEHREWLWKGYLGRNKVAHFGGASTEGKSPVTLDIIARVTSGADWPDGTRNELGPQSAILLAAEDDWSDTIIPRLEIAGANLAKVKRFFVKQQTVELTPSLDNDCQRLEQEIEHIGDVALVVIDPITNYLGSKKMNMEEEIRGGILMPLSQLAKNKHCAVITVGHLNKRGSEVTVLQRLMGAAAANELRITFERPFKSGYRRFIIPEPR